MLVFGLALQLFFNPQFKALDKLDAEVGQQYQQGCLLMSGAVALVSLLGCWLFSISTDDERLNEFELSNQT
jgi:hypothetical protein